MDVHHFQEVEKERDELQLKVELLERQLDDFATREADLQKLADQARTLKDEVSAGQGPVL
jgi:hypothetical protein